MTILQPDRPKRSMLLRLINTIGRPWAKNGFSFLRLDETTLLNKACAQTGLDDFGDDSFREALRVLLRAYETDAQLSFVGRICVHEDLVRLLNNRLRLIEDRRRHPGIAAESHPPPAVHHRVAPQRHDLLTRHAGPGPGPPGPASLGSNASFPAARAGVLRH